jgi:hypothetical protein
MFEPAGEWLPPVSEAVPEWVDERDPSQVDIPWTDADALAEAVDRRDAAGLLLSLMQVDPARLSGDQVSTYALQVARFAAIAAGLQACARAASMARLVEVFSEAPRPRGSGFVTPEMSASAELAAALRMAPRTVDAQFEYAGDLAGPMRGLHDGAALRSDLGGPRVRDQPGAAAAAVGYGPEAEG